MLIVCFSIYFFSGDEESEMDGHSQDDLSEDDVIKENRQQHRNSKDAGNYVDSSRSHLKSQPAAHPMTTNKIFPGNLEIISKEASAFNSNTGTSSDASSGNRSSSHSSQTVSAPQPQPQPQCRKKSNPTESARCNCKKSKCLKL